MGDLGHVNSSGFPLQLGLEHLVQETQDEHKWCFLSREHPWKNDTLGNGGFIDLVFENKYRTEVMVIECKRVRDTAWIFLVPTKEVKNRRHVNAWFYGDNFFDWKDLTSDPASPESEFCVIPGNDQKSRPMIERTAAELIDATEALAIEEYNLKSSDLPSMRIYYSVIVTTAELKVCNFDLADIDIKSGELQIDSFQTVPFVRFRKSLSICPPKNVTYKNIKELDKATERGEFTF